MIHLTVASLLLVSGAIMYSASKNRRIPLQNRGKLIAFIMVVVTIALLILVGSRSMFPRTAVSLAEGSVYNTASVVETVVAYKLSVAVTPSSAVIDEIFYGIMFDAGSTGTRVHVFQFKHVAAGKPFEYVDELFEHVKPGLSAFAEEPQKGAESVAKLLDKAKNFIPESKWRSTPLALKATAGLRLLPKEQAEALLEAVIKLFHQYPFKVDQSSVSIMDGMQEGVFSWFTLNFLKGTLGVQSQMVGVMDLGGGSTQITFVPQEEKTLGSAPKDFIQEMHIFGNQVKLYTHSYLGLGLMSGRLQTLGGKEGSDTNPDTFTSPCFPANYSGKWSHGTEKYAIKGMTVSGSRFEACTAKTKAVIGTVVQQPEELTHKPFYVISYYFDKAVDAGLIAKKKKVPTATLR